ncbi:MAG: heme biosynthesis HemY N-terminal domain-containing protein [Candidatus Zeuxoniibacter abyssi]|nr:MAG: heme biosynthesis HemY N-terminal domain-containing protein [Candidatus Persebacteraceae bacterium AB1(2)]
MIYIACFIILVAVLIGVSQLYLTDPVLIRYGQWQAEPGVAVATVLAVVISLVVLFKIVAKIILLPLNFAHWRRQSAAKKHHQTLLTALRALILGDEKKALKIFSRLTEEKNDDPGVYGMLAAEAAKGVGDKGRHKRLLQRAAVSTDTAIAALANATLTRQEGRFTEAVNTLNTADDVSNNSAIIKLRLEINRELRHWRQALADVYQLRDMFPDRSWEADIGRIIGEQIKAATNTEELSVFWKKNVQDKDKAALTADYAFALYRLGDEKHASEVLAKTLKTGVSTPPFLAAIAAVGDKRSCEEALANNQKRGAETKDENILSALAALSERLELWGKARRYYQMANALRPNHRYVQALAELERKSSESTSAP